MFQWLRNALFAQERIFPRRGEPDPTFIPLGSPAFWPGADASTRVATLNGIIKLLIDAVVPLPRYVWRGAQRIEHPLEALLAQPFSRWDRWRGYEYPIRSMLTTGNGYWRVRRGRGRIPVDLVPARSGGAYYADDGRRRYTLTDVDSGSPGNGYTDLDRHDVVALHWAETGDLISPSPIQHTLSTVLGIQGGTFELLGRQLARARASGPVLKHEATAPGAPTHKQIVDITNALHGANREAVLRGGTPTLAPGLAPSAIPGLSQADVIAVDFLRWTVEDMCRVYSVAPGRVGQMSGAGAGVRTQGYQDQVADFAKFAAQPVARKVDNALSFTLLSASERIGGLEIRCDPTDLSLGSPSDLAALGVALVGGGTHTPNEVREKYHGLEPKEGGDTLSPPRGSAAPGKGQNQGDKQ